MQAETRKRKMLLDSNHVTPEAMNFERETKLRKLAQRGVVTLFNAVRKQQKDQEQSAQGAGRALACIFSFNLYYFLLF